MGKAVAKKQTTAVSKVDFGLGDDYTGIQVQEKDVVIPHIQLLQKGVEWEELNDIAWKPGDFYNTATGAIIKDGFNALVVDMKVTTRMYGPKDQGGRRETLKFSPDGQYWDDGTPITQQDRNPKDKEDFLNGTAVDSYHYVIIPEGSDFPVVLTFKGASVRNAKNLNFPLNRLKPTWANWCKFYSEDGESNGNKFKRLVGKVQPKKPLEDQELANLALATYQASNSRVVVSPEMQEESEDEPTY